MVKQIVTVDNTTSVRALATTEVLEAAAPTADVYFTQL